MWDSEIAGIATASADSAVVVVQREDKYDSLPSPS